MTAEHQQEVASANDAFYAAIETGDIDLMGRLWVRDDAAVPAYCVHPGTVPVQGREPVLRSWSLIMANTAYIQFVVTDVEVVIDGGLAVVTCRENILTGNDAGGLGGGLVTAVNGFLLTPDGWRMWLHHAGPVPGRTDTPRELADET